MKGYPKRKRKRMYAVSCEGLGLIGGTLGYSRREAISHFQGGAIIAKEWEQQKRQGYRTVMAMVEIVKQ